MTGKYKTFKRIYNNSLFLIRSLLTFLWSEQSFVSAEYLWGADDHIYERPSNLQ